VISRRTFLRATAGTALSGAALGGYTWQIEPHWLEITRQPLRVDGLPAALRHRTMVQLSDIHVGARVSDDYLARAFERVRALAPDIVLYTGDFTSHHETIFAHAERVYRDAPRGQLATLGILGNHDYGPNWAHPEIAERLVTVLGAAGIRVLRNEVSDVEGLQFLGMDDLWADRFDPGRGLAALERGRPAIALSHNPDTADLPGWGAFEGWILAGHTHGGQCRPPFLPPPLLPVRNRRYTSGVFELDRNRRLYISRGVGHLTQVRFNVRPEVAVFELEPG
jgi:uncharacterized protein